MVDKHLHYKIKKWEKRKIWNSSWHQWKRYLDTVNGKCWKCQPCCEYSRLLNIWMQLQKGAFVDTRFIEYHMPPFSSRRNVCHVWISVSHSQINQQHTGTKYLWLVNNILIWRNKCWKWMTLWDNKWCHKHIHIEEKYYIITLWTK